MLIALATSLLLLALSAGCAHRLWHSRELWHALVFLPAIILTWAGSLFVREPTNGSALLTFLAGDMSLFGLSVLGVMRMLGGLPPDDDDPWGDEDDEEPQVEPPAPAHPRRGTHGRPAPRGGVRRPRDYGGRRPSRARAKSSSDRSERSTS